VGEKGVGRKSAQCSEEVDEKEGRYAESGREEVLRSPTGDSLVILEKI